MSAGDRPQGAAKAGACPAARVAWIDRARGIALVAMIVFHFSYDLDMLGVTQWDVGGAPGWRLFAMSIAGSFIALAGVSLQLAHGRGVRWRGFLRRLGQLVLAAAAVTLATHYAMGAAVWFGILHAIAVFSVLALPFLFAPGWLVALAALLTLAAPHVLTSDLFSHPALYPLGLSPTRWFALDYEPVFPWFAATLAGLLVARIAPLPRGPVASDLLARMGRHSLVIYLLHQPILLAILMGARQLGLL
ncbi:heparan-alpha-glucosaminide N-acetyltransferase [Palleronia pelagia]|uniref:Uncharacterized membrane protein n=1 Tax=Palleronia pelagia TaxID=387096 RepID=A0A1H8AW96_9RHOB|nr:heparan-alpha-glucosaminide N-acetyltransferase [Palleronia pelagia]SEM74823.1 Uncharacterized membrane protein [Palleronia pelagia]